MAHFSLDDLKVITGFFVIRFYIFEKQQRGKNEELREKSEVSARSQL
ncbi:hypothetical protein HMPREF0645_1371 [Hallella bergensis DSM 17361]|uniref:Uncharacterized protein n=1 Tax=Hallella bergensis DSM 17361 TaxID=585502 RepID=D1PWN6_9BACT|nr:hypothetical protein HMPREF0645_1371 [Hallella bergensis DSM 17361]